MGERPSYPGIARIAGVFLALAAARWLAPRAAAQTVSLAGSINSGTLSADWSAYAPNPNGYTSSYSINTGNYLTLNDREWLSLASAPSAANTSTTISGSFDITNTGDFLTIATHTSAAPSTAGSQYGVSLNSVSVEFSSWGGTGGGVVIALTGNSETPVYTTVLAAGLLNTNQTYSYAVADNGSTISVTLNGSLLGSYNYGSSTYYTGGTGTDFVIYDRESSSGLEIAGLNFTAVPEPSTWCLMLVGVAGFALGGWPRLRRKSRTMPA